MKLMIDFEPKAGFTQSEVPEAYKILKPVSDIANHC